MPFGRHVHDEHTPGATMGQQPDVAGKAVGHALLELVLVGPTDEVVKQESGGIGRELRLHESGLQSL